MDTFNNCLVFSLRSVIMSFLVSIMVEIDTPVPCLPSMEGPSTSLKRKRTAYRENAGRNQGSWFHYQATDWKTQSGLYNGLGLWLDAFVSKDDRLPMRIIIRRIPTQTECRWPRSRELHRCWYEHLRRRRGGRWRQPRDGWVIEGNVQYRRRYLSRRQRARPWHDWRERPDLRHQ